ncbi:chorion class B protein Ld34-like [Pieris rapae]|uniref:chorion class B protein Ld34-like n=1 Tax=Pieris rapae TaxID=64459 RepID=UPI001E28043A|nr:chorion class B protein Ld34-like [Pieris rapae]
MAAKAVLVVCAQILLVQSISCLYAPFGPANCLAANSGSVAGLASPFGLLNAAYGPGMLNTPYAPLNAVASTSASHGGPLPVASSSPLPPNGVSVLSENRIEGPLAVAGELPFLGTVALEGPLPTVGSGAVNFGAGNGNVAITREDAARGNGRFAW